MVQIPAVDRPDVPTGNRTLIFWLACGASFLLYLHRYSWNIVGPELQRDLNLTYTQNAVLFSLFYYTYASLQIPSGIIVDRFGPHRFLTSMLATWSLALVAMAHTTNIFLLGFWRLAFGATQAGCYPALTKVTSQWFPLEQRTIIQGWIATAFGRCGGAMAPIIVGTLFMGVLGFTWQVSVTELGLLGVLYSVIFWSLFRSATSDASHVRQAKPLPAHDARETGTLRTRGSVKKLAWRAAFRSRSLRVFTLQQFLDAGSDVVFVSLIGAYFLRAHGFDISKTGWLASLPLWGGALGGIVGGWLNDTLIRITGNRRWSRSCVGFVGKMIGCLLIGLVVMQSSGETAAWLLMAAKFFSDWSQPTTWGMCTDIGGRFSATIFSIVNTAGTIGGIIMPLVFAFLLDRYTSLASSATTAEAVTDWSPLFVLLSAMYLACGFCWLLIDCTQSLDEELR